MIKKFTEQDMQNYADYVAKAVLSNIQPDLTHWYAEWHKTAKKVIDLSVLIESGIDCEVTNNSIKSNNWEIRQLQSIYSDGNSGWPYRTEKGTHEKCRPRMNHKHAWLHNNCPIEGFVVRVWFDKEDFTTVDTSFNIINWNNVIWVEFLKLEDGYVMPWEQDNE